LQNGQDIAKPMEVSEDSLHAFAFFYCDWVASALCRLQDLPQLKYFFQNYEISRHRRDLGSTQLDGLVTARGLQGGWWEGGGQYDCRSLMSLFRDCFSLFMFLAASDVYSD
jgi:hypothetical protein